jgi:hypothetical protein
MVAPPHWLKVLGDRVASAIYPIDILPPLGCHYQLVDGVWEVTLFASQTEVIGGPRDGSRTPSRFHLDIKALLELFDEVHGCSWQSMTVDEADDLGAHVSVEGLYEQHHVWLRLPARAPECFDPGRHAIVHERQWKEIW